MQIDQKVLASLKTIPKGFIGEIHTESDLCNRSINGLSLWEAALNENNESVIKYLLSFPEFIESFVPLKESEGNAPYIGRSENTEGCLDKAEQNLRRLASQEVSFLRTPLMSACRKKHKHAMRLLIENNANLKGKDIFGINVFEICWEVGGEEFLNDFLTLLRAKKCKFKLDGKVLTRMLIQPQAIESLSDYHELDASAKRVLFNYYCATLQVKKVAGLLANGFKINQMHSKQYHAVFEACTSHLVWEYAYPNHLSIAYHVTKAVGLASATSISFVMEGENWGEINRQTILAAEKRKTEAREFTLSSQQIDEQLKLRLSLLDLFLKHGLDAQLVEKKAPDSFLSWILDCNQPELLHKLVECGFNLITDDYDYFTEEQKTLLNSVIGNQPATPHEPANTSAFYDSPYCWELENETTLYAKLSQGQSVPGSTEIQVSLCNLYGPLENVSIHIAFSDGKLESEPMKLLGEYIDLDEGKIALEELTEPLLEEAPWSALYSIFLTNDKVDKELLIKLSSSTVNAELAGLNCSIEE